MRRVGSSFLVLRSSLGGAWPRKALVLWDGGGTFSLEAKREPRSTRDFWSASAGNPRLRGLSLQRGQGLADAGAGAEGAHLDERSAPAGEGGDFSDGLLLQVEEGKDQAVVGAECFEQFVEHFLRVRRGL